MNLYALHPRLFIRGHTRHIDAQRVLHELARNDVRLVLNVALINDPILAAACRTVGVDYHHVPLHDSGTKNDWAQVREVARSVARRLPDYGVLVHCDSGWNRSALVSILALMYHTGRPASELIAEAREVRGPKLLKNTAFERFLLEERP